MSNRIFKRDQINIINPYNIIVNNPEISQAEKEEYIDFGLTEDGEPENDYDIFENNETSVEIDISFKIEEKLKQAEADCGEMIKNAQAEADQIIAKAKDAAAQITSQSEEFIEARRVEIEQDAQKQGYDAGIANARREADNIINDVNAYKNNALLEIETMLKNMEPEIVSIIMDISKKIIGDELSYNKNKIISIINQALDKCIDTASSTLRLSENDYIYVNQNMDAIKEHLGNRPMPTVKNDREMKSGQVVIESSNGDIDASLDSQLEKLQEIFLKNASYDFSDNEIELKNDYDIINDETENIDMDNINIEDDGNYFLDKDLFGDDDNK